MDDFPRDNALGRFEDLLQKLKDLDHDSPREPFGGMAFEVSPTQYLEFLEMETRSDPGPFDYSCGVLYYKQKTSFIHRRLSNRLKELIWEEIDRKWTRDGTFPSSKLWYCARAEVRNNQEFPTIDMAPDVAVVSSLFGKLQYRWPPLVAEIAYAHRFTRDKLEERYKEYFKVGYVQIVLCLDVFYARDPDRASKTASALDRSAISMWIRDENGDIQTIMG
ncbi:hypothetical protein B0I37DRAFT_220112 [Chaetomium sp. MPI-CAGE-AT-0009]|nr:hypothetical protein B0I37DRAFT_220112 [Chaetomium sp. MPI-CAGE-AT-0009]